MICPACGSEGEIAYSSLSSGLVCLAADCGWEQEIAWEDVNELVSALEEVPAACCP